MPQHRLRIGGWRIAFVVICLGISSPPPKAIPSQPVQLAQSPVCYIEDANGRTIDLYSLCTPSRPQCYFRGPQGRTINLPCKPSLDQYDLINRREFVRRLMSTRHCTDCDLQRLGLAGVFLAQANLSGANLSGASLQNANLRNADLSNSNLTDANLYGAVLAGANLTGANLTGAVITEADLDGATLSGTTMPDGTVYP